MIEMRAQLLGRALKLPRRTKRLLMIGSDALFVPLLMYVAVALKSGEWVVVDASIARSALAAFLTAMPLFARIGLYRAVVRFMGPRAALTIGLGAAGSVLALLALSFFGVLGAIGQSTLLIYAALLLVYLGSSRMSLRWALLPGRDSAAPVVIYGAGQGGAELASALTTRGEFRPVGFIDDNPTLYRTVVAGIRVHKRSILPSLLAEHKASHVLLAMPGLSPMRRREILKQLAPLRVHVQSIPSVAALMAGTAKIDDIEEVDVTDLLGREPVPPNQQLLEACIRGKNVLVTGAGGSIGSELCRQIVRLHPRRLLLLEMSEVALYRIELELGRTISLAKLDVEVVPLLGNAHHKYRVREILQAFEVQTIYHAAAYKHVPIVEQNLIEGLHNNVFSTWYAGEAALECKVETFVLVSTDKAVNPPNVMGATKRFAEIVLQGLQQRTSETRFCMVRFGNVLESSGSVVPLFRDQIRRGGPVTVTHPDVMRYFMTIPEAAQLVIQAGAMAEGGDVFVLDMGKPVRIIELAQRMIQMSGRSVRDAEHPEGDVEIHFTGLRPAEKLFEELLIGKNVAGTKHPMILRAVEHAPAWDEIRRLLDLVTVAMRRFDCLAAREIVERAVIEYQPPGEIQDIVWVRRKAPVSSVASSGDGKVTDLEAHRVPRLPVHGSSNPL